MKKMLVPFFAIVMLGSLLVVGGCSSTQGADTHAKVDGMMCPKCETVWTVSRTPSGPRDVTALRKKPEMTCESCDATAKAVLLEDGSKQLHDCPTCKVTPVMISNHFEKGHKHPR